MNSWDDNADERVRQRWQAVFTHFEVQASPSLRRRVLGPLARGRRYRLARWVGVGFWLLATLPLSDDDQPPVLSTAWRPLAKPVPAPPLSTSRPEDQVPITPLPTATGPTGQREERITRNRSVLPYPAQPRSQAWASTSKELKRDEVVSYPATPSAGLHPLPQTPGKTRLSRPHSAYAPGAGAGGNRSAWPSDPSLPAAGESSMEGLTDGWPRLGSIGTKPLAISLNARALPRVVEATPSLPETAVTTVVQRPKRWFVEGVAQSSFQWMRASETSTAYLSQVGIPAAFSPATWGYQFRGGLRFNRWQANLLLGQLRSWATYTVNENRYRVAPSPTNAYELVRESYTVTENTLRPMVGAGFGQHQPLHQGRYWIELGGQILYLPTSDQTLALLRGSAGRRLLVRGGDAWSVGLSFDYGLNHLPNEQKQLSIRPLIVGVGLRLAPSSTAPRP